MYLLTAVGRGNEENAAVRVALPWLGARDFELNIAALMRVELLTPLEKERDARLLRAEDATPSRVMKNDPIALG